MYIFQAHPITGMMVGIEFGGAPNTKHVKCQFSVVLDVFIVRFIFQKLKYVR